MVVYGGRGHLTEEVGSTVETEHISQSIGNYLGGLASRENGSLHSACQIRESLPTY